MSGKGAKRNTKRGGISTNLDSGLTPSQRRAAEENIRVAGALQDADARTQGYGDRHAVTIGGKLAEIQEDAFRSGLTDDSSGDGYLGDLKPIHIDLDDNAPGGVWLFWSAADQRRIETGNWCSWCGQRQQHQWGTQPGRSAHLLHGVGLNTGDPADPTHPGHLGGYCLPVKGFSSSCLNKPREGIFRL